MNDQFPDKKRYEVSGKTQTIGMDYTTAACLCYIPVPLLGAIAAGVWLITEPKANLYVRFHAIQSLLVIGGLFVGYMLVSMINLFHSIPIIGGVFALMSGITLFVVVGVWFIITCWLTLKAKSGEMYKLPFIGDIAENLALK